MAAVEVTITGVIWDKLARTGRPVVIIGEASLTGLSVGGGPMPPGQGGGGDPPGIWGGPIDPYPDHGLPGRPGTWPDQRPPHPAHPIVTPPPGGGTPPDGGKPPDPVQPPIEWKAVWHPTEGWVVVGIPNFPHPSPSSE